MVQLPAAGNGAARIEGRSLTLRRRAAFATLHSAHGSHRLEGRLQRGHYAL